MENTEKDKVIIECAQKSVDFCIVILEPEHSKQWRVFEDVIFSLQSSLAKLGFFADILHNAFSDRAVNIVFCLQDHPEYMDKIPHDSIIYNFEQVVAGSKVLRPHYIEALQKYSVWDYSKKNVDILKNSFGIKNIYHVPVGNTENLECLDVNYPTDIDVLFYGVINERRQKILKALQEHGLRVLILENSFGHERNHYIARSKVILNMHYFVPGILEEVRASFLWANHKMLVCERNHDTYVPQDLEDIALFVPYEKLVDVIIHMLKAPERQKKYAAQAYACFAKREYVKILAQTLQKMQCTPKSTVHTPKRMNAGSGKDFKNGYLNVDVEPSMRPDLLLDLSEPLNFETTYTSKRHGAVRLQKNSFEEILAGDILEHVPNLVQTMTNFMELLRVGGQLIVHVPYELSEGAWRDPTHIRAFNVESFRYYTQWAWYVGWRDYCFSVKDMMCEFSVWGKKLLEEKHTTEELLRIPRAIDALRVILEKRVTTKEEKREYDLQHRCFYKK